MAPDVQAEVHVWVEGSGYIVALIASDRALKLAIEGLVDDTVAVFGVC